MYKIICLCQCLRVKLSVCMYSCLFGSMCVCVTEGYKVHQYTARAHSARARTLRIVVKCIHLINANRGERKLDHNREANKYTHGECGSEGTTDKQYESWQGDRYRLSRSIYSLDICTYVGTCCTIALQVNKTQRWF